MKGIVFLHSTNKCNCDGLFDSQLVSNSIRPWSKGFLSFPMSPSFSRLSMQPPYYNHLREFCGICLFVCLFSLDYRGNDMVQWVRTLAVHEDLSLDL